MPKGAVKKYSEEFVYMVLELRNSGMTYPQISKMTGIPPESLRSMLNRKDLQGKVLTTKNRNELFGKYKTIYELFDKSIGADKEEVYRYALENFDVEPFMIVKEYRKWRENYMVASII